jgi:hypothetical protein
MYKNLFLAFSLLCVCTARAQTKIIIHENTTQPGPPASDTARKEGDGNILRDGESILKFNVLPFLKGDYCISFEKKIARNTSAEITTGLTYYDILNDLQFQEYFPSDMYKGGYRLNRAGGSLRGGLRWYLKSREKELNGFYIGAEGLYRKYRSEISLLNNATISFSHYNEYSGHKEIRAYLGYQHGDGCMLDYSAGFAYRTHNRQYLGYPNGNSQAIPTLTKANKGYLIFWINFRIGVSFGY